jgi:hypothetical protein
LKLAGEVRIEKSSVTPESGDDEGEELRAGRGKAWEEEVSPDFLALHFRHRDEAERVKTKAVEDEEKEKEKTTPKSLMRKASERALRRASVLQPVPVPDAITDADEDRDWHERAQAASCVRSPSRAHTPKPSVSLGVTPEIVVSAPEHAASISVPIEGKEVVVEA